MSKTQKDKVIIDYESAPILADLDFPELLKEFRRLKLEEDDLTSQVAKWNAKRKVVGSDIQAALEAVKADSVDYNSGKRQWRATLVKGEPSQALNEDKLRDNLMKMAKLDAKTVAPILKASSDEVPGKKPYVLVTIQE